MATINTGVGRQAIAAEPLLRGREGEVVGVAVFADSLNDVEANVSVIRRQILISGAAALVIAVLAGYLVARALSMRVKRLEVAARKVAGGDFTDPIQADSDDELGQLADAFDDMQAQLARLDRARKQFIASASHELRTPIFSLGGFLELLADEELDEDTRRQFLEQLQGQVERMRNLATELLDLSRLESGALELRPEPTDVGQLAREVAAEFTPAAARHKADVRLDLQHEPIELDCDPERVAQVLRILLDNALVHTPRRDGRPCFGRTRQRARAAGGLRQGPRDQATEHASHLRALLHLQRRGAGRRPRPGDRPRARRPHARSADRPLGPRSHHLLPGAPVMKRLAAVCAALSIGLTGCLGGDDSSDSSSKDNKTTTTRVQVVESQGSADGKRFDSQSIFKNEGQGVVTIISLFGSGGLSDILNGGGGGGGVGSGFVLNGQGEIATNAHVVTQGEGKAVEKAREVYVEFADGNRVEAKIMGQDPNADVALLKIDPKGLTLRPLPLGSSASVPVGSPGRRDRVAVRRAPVALGRRRRRRSTATSSRSTASSRSPAPSRRTPRSTPATPAARWSTPPAR